MKINVKVSGVILEINAVDKDEKGFKLFHRNERLALIKPKVDDNLGVIWKTLDHISPSIIEQDGNKLESIGE